MIATLRQPATIARLSGLVDQGLFSIATLLQSFAYAKLLPPEQFGIFGLIQGTVLLAAGVQRSAVILPMIMTSQADGADRIWRRADFKLRLILSTTLIVLALFGEAAGIRPSFRTAFALAGLCTVATLFYEFQRRVLFLHQRTNAVLAAAATYFGISCIAVTLVLLWMRNVATAAIGLFVAAIGAGAVARWRRAPQAADKGPPQSGAVATLLALRGVAPGVAPMIALAVGWGAGGLLAWVLLKMHLRRGEASG